MTKTKMNPNAGLTSCLNRTPGSKANGDVEAWIASDKDQVVEQAKARLMLSPATSAAVAASTYLRTFGEQDLQALIHVLDESINQAQKGDLQGVEAMLIGQAQALQAIFMGLADQSGRTGSIQQLESYLRLALKAQAQCCRTIEVLAAMKNPPIVLARQANITSGPQQINNGIETPLTTPACKQAEFVKNELFEGGQHEQRMDPGTPRQASAGHSAMEAMASINGTTKRRR